MEIRIERDPAVEDAQVLSRGIMAFNRDTVRDLEPVDAEVRFHVFARSESGAIEGGIRASCYWNTLHIELLWLDTDARGKGNGRLLIEAAERFARENLCQNALVETTSWQARSFYEKNGYRLMASLPDRPKGHTSHYLAKSL